MIRTRNVSPLSEQAIVLIHATDYKAAADLLSKGLTTSHDRQCRLYSNKVKTTPSNDSVQENMTSMFRHSNIPTIVFSYAAGALCSMLSGTYLANTPILGGLFLFLGRFLYLYGLCVGCGLFQGEDNSNTFESVVQLKEFLVDSSNDKNMQQEIAAIKEQHASFGLFDKLLAVPSHLSTKREVESKLQCAILLYNHALRLQLGGLSSGSEEQLNESLLSYDTALHLLDAGNKGSLIQLVLRLALLNNSACSHSYFVDRRLTQECLEQMRPLVQTLDEHRGNEPSETNETVSQALATFSVNLLCNESQEFRPAPVA